MKGVSQMYEQLYASLPNKEAYLERISIKVVERLGLEDLNVLILAHQCAIPFENLDIYEYDKDINLGIAKLFEKVINQKRGGYCFELNALFMALLQECGFDVYACNCRIVRGKDFIPPSLHRGTIVKLSGRLWFADVGYGGPMPAGALLVEDGYEITYCGQTFKVNREDEYWWTIIYISSKGSETIMQFTTMPQEVVEFVSPNEYCSKNEMSVFRNVRLVNRRTSKGSLAITGDLFTEISEGRRNEKKIQSPEELNQILKDYFNIDLPQ